LKARIGSGREIYVLADTSYGRHADLSRMPLPSNGCVAAALMKLQLSMSMLMLLSTMVMLV
jgi:hypothetical protein